MLRAHSITVATFFRAISLVALLLCSFSIDTFAMPARSNVVARETISSANREQLVAKLRQITGLTSLRFDENGILREGNSESTIGSEEARKLLRNSIQGRNVVVLEDASNRSDVAFCRVIPGTWKRNVAGPPAFVVQIDFADFNRLVGDERALAAFNVGWGLLHELDHIANNSIDAASLDETGECEANINRMRRECNLPERANYFFTLSPLATNTTFMTRFVRLAFDEQGTNKKKRYWITWDANVVGGLEQNQVATLR